MVNAATETTANPLAMLMGLFVPSGEIKTPDGSDPFSVFMGLVPSLPVTDMPVLEGAAPESTAAADGLVAPSNGNVVLSLTPDAMALLGIDAQRLPVQPQVSSTDATAEPQTQIPAELTVTDDAADGRISLRIPGMTSEVDGLEDGSLEQNGTQELVIPMHLRTVEQVGRKVIATADLLTAAGKETSVRIQWDLSGCLNGNQETMETSGQTAGSLPETQPAGGPGTLSRLLNNVGATLMVIENIEAPSSPAMPALLPGAAVVPTKSSTAKADPAAITVNPSSSSSLPTAASTVASSTVATVQAMPVETEVTMTASSTLPASDGSVVEDSLDMIETPVDDTPASATKSVDEASATPGKLPGVDSAALDSSTGITRTAASARETTAVRFLDLDAKLDQLKSTGGQKIRIQLVPANLGKMELTIASHRGLVTVTLNLDSNQAREAVQQSLPVLENRLAASGIRVDNFQVVASPSSRETLAASTSQTVQHDGLGGYRREGQDRRQEYRAPRQQYESPGDFTFNAAMVNCLA